MLKDVSYDQLIAAIRAVAGGATVFQPAVTARLLQVSGRVHIQTDTPSERLTNREVDSSPASSALRTARGAKSRQHKSLAGFPSIGDILRHSWGPRDLAKLHPCAAPSD
jgi:hypothetical protein